MEAVIFDSNKMVLSYEPNHPLPKLLTDTDVIIKVEYAGVCGTDLHVIQGEYPSIKERPFVMGHETSGIIHEAGPKSNFKKGQKVVVDPESACNLCSFCRKGTYHYCQTAGINSTIGIFQDGGWAQYMRAPQEQVFLLPDNVTTEQAGLCEPYSCVVHGFDRVAPLKIGAKILVAGAGIIGNLWVTALHHQGHRDVSISELNPTRLELVKKLDTGFRLITPDVLKSEKQLYDVIIDCTGVGKVMEINFDYLNYGGKYVLFGCCPPTHTAAIKPFEVFSKELTLIGITINPFSFPGSISWLTAMGERYLSYEKLGVKTYKLSEYKSAVEDLRKGIIAKAMFKVE